MDSTLERQFLDYSAGKLHELAQRIATCLGQLTLEQVWARGGENQNAIGNLVLHLAGNVRQWIIAGVGGRPDMRDRASEFQARGGQAPSELAALLRQTVEEARVVIGGISAASLPRPLTIQGYTVSEMEAVYHVVEHFSMHAGQILFATKMFTGADLGFYRHLESAAARGRENP
jgi:uncharacterized damage-inducible protein DinB